MKNPKGYLFPMVLAALLGGCIWWSACANGDHRQKVLSQQSKIDDELARLKAEQARYENTLPSKHELEQLTKDMQEVAELSARIEKLNAAQSTPVSAVPEKRRPRSAVELWNNLGQTTPANTLESVIWASIGGEVDQLASMLAYDPDSRAAADALYYSLSPESRKYFPDAEKLVTALVASRVPTDLVNAKLIEKTNENPDLVVASFQVQRGSKAAVGPRNVVFRFQRVGSDWKLLVPASAIEEFRRSLVAN